MPKGPQGQRRPADAIGGAIAVAKIATGEIEEVTSDNSQKGVAGGKARARKLSSGERSFIASAAAKKRWNRTNNGTENMMTQTAKQETEAQAGREAVRMYPSNQLKEQVREFGTNLSAFSVMKEAFSEKN